MAKISKFIYNILAKEAIYIKNRLSRIDTLNFGIDPTSTGFVLIDEDSNRLAIGHDSFYTYLLNIDKVISAEHYDYFCSEDEELHELLEQFYYTELLTSQFRNGIAKDSYTSQFIILSKPVEAKEAPSVYVYMSARDEAYLMVEESEGEN